MRVLFVSVYGRLARTALLTTKDRRLTTHAAALLTLRAIVFQSLLGIFCRSSFYEPMANLFESPRYIAVEGPIRVGKSTLSRILGERLNAPRVAEPEDNPFLQAFYQGESGAAFQAQLAFLIGRFERLRELDPGSRAHTNIV